MHPIMSVCLVTAPVKLDHLREVCAILLYLRGTILLLLITKESPG